MEQDQQKRRFHLRLRSVLLLLVALSAAAVCSYFFRSRETEHISPVLLSQVRIGMSPDEVESILGVPHSNSDRGDTRGVTWGYLMKVGFVSIQFYDEKCVSVREFAGTAEE
jgi:outer membrane protein assembly factor BamE (lipoprotein component of BamABCDE complex)